MVGAGPGPPAVALMPLLLGGTAVLPPAAAPVPMNGLLLCAVGCNPYVRMHGRGFRRWSHRPSSFARGFSPRTPGVWFNHRPPPRCRIGSSAFTGTPPRGRLHIAFIALHLPGRRVRQQGRQASGGRATLCVSPAVSRPPTHPPLPPQPPPRPRPSHPHRPHPAASPSHPPPHPPRHPSPTPPPNRATPTPRTQLSP